MHGAFRRSPGQTLICIILLVCITRVGGGRRRRSGVSGFLRGSRPSSCGAARLGGAPPVHLGPEGRVVRHAVEQLRGFRLTSAAGPKVVRVGLHLKWFALAMH